MCQTGSDAKPIPMPNRLEPLALIDGPLVIDGASGLLLVGCFGLWSSSCYNN